MKFEVFTSDVGNITIIDTQKNPYNINQDGIVNILNIVIITKNIDKVGKDVVGDVNGGGTVDKLDIDMLINHFCEKIK